jgi:hypothetical protein
MKKSWAEIESQNIKIYSQLRSKPALNFISFHLARIWMGFVLLFSDLISLLIASSLALVIWSHVRSDLILKDYLSIAFLVFMFPLSYLLTGLYPAIGKARLKNFVVLLSPPPWFFSVGNTFLLHAQCRTIFASSFGIAWAFALFMVPVSRNIFRSICSMIGLWGEPVALIGYENEGSKFGNS